LKRFKQALKSIQPFFPRKGINPLEIKFNIFWSDWQIASFFHQKFKKYPVLGIFRQDT